MKSRQLQLLSLCGAHLYQAALTKVSKASGRMQVASNFQSTLKHQKLVRHFSSTRSLSMGNNSKEDDDSKTRKLDAKEMLENAASFENIDHEADKEGWSTTPYPRGTEKIKRQSQASYSFRPKVDPHLTSIIVFPGQGTQFVGMGKKLLKFPIARDLFEYASEILKYDIKKLCLEGPIEELSKTVYSQPAIFVCSLAAVEGLKEERPSAIENCIATAGYSLGEITALTFAGAFTFEKALNLVRVRAEAMQLASEMESSGMATMFYGANHKTKTALLKAREWCIEKGIEHPVCSVASYLYPDCKVIAGHTEALKFLEANKQAFGIRRLQRLRVSGAFHTDLMRPAVDPFIQALKRAETSDPVIAVHSNLDGKIYRNAANVYKQLPSLLTKPIKWEQTLHILYERPQGVEFPRTYECGPGHSLRQILEKVNLVASKSCENMEA